MKPIQSCFLSILLFFFISFPNFSLSQQFTEGFIVTLEKDTVLGKWKEKFNIQKGQKLEFVKDGKTSIFKPDDILAYGIQNVYLKESHEIEISNPTDPSKQITRISFVEYLVKGELSLYFYKERKKGLGLYVGDNENKLTNIYFKKEKFYQGDKIYYKTELQYEQFLRNLMGTCYDPQNRFKKGGFNRKQAIQVFNDYHECINKPSHTYEYKTPKIQKIGVEFSQGMYNLPEDVGFKDQLQSIEKSRFGIYYRRTVFNNPSLFFQTSLRYQQFNSNQNDTLVQTIDGRTGRSVFTETHKFGLDISMGKQIDFERAYFVTQGGIGLVNMIRQPLIQENDMSFQFINKLFIEMALGVKMSQRIDVELFTGFNLLINYSLFEETGGSTLVGLRLQSRL